MNKAPNQLERIFATGALALAALVGASPQTVLADAKSIDGIEVVERSITVNATLSEVWKAIATSDGLVGWIAPEARVEPRIGGAYEVYFWPEEPVGHRGIENTTILSIVPERVLSYWGSSPPNFPKIHLQNVAWTTYTLRDLGAGKVEITESGAWPTFDEPWEADFRKWVDTALGIGLGRLATYLETGSIEGPSRLSRSEERQLDG